MTSVQRLKKAQIFDWTDPVSGIDYSFAVELILRDVREFRVPFQMVVSPLDEAFCREWLDKRGVDIDYAIRRADDPQWLNEPVITLMQRDGSGLMVDGQHRYAANYMLGKKELLHRLIDYPFWLKYRNDSGLWRAVRSPHYGK